MRVVVVGVHLLLGVVIREEGRREEEDGEGPPRVVRADGLQRGYGRG